jgi:hypothetical protein
MAKTFDQNAADDFRIILHYLTVRWNCTDSYLAKKLECTPQTLSNIRKNPLGTSSGYTERIRRYAKLEAKKQNDEEAAEIRRLL